MTSKLTREELLNIIETDHVQCGESSALARMALAAMDSEPVAWMHNNNNIGIPAITTSPKIGQYWMSEFKDVQPLYRHAQQPVAQPVMFIDGDISSDDADKLAKVIREFNEEDERPLAKMARTIRENPHPTNECDMPKAPEYEPVKRFNADQMHRICLEANRHLDKYSAMAKEVNKLLGRIPAQTAPVVPEEWTLADAFKFCEETGRQDAGSAMEAWNACRAAMLEGDKK